MGSESRKKRQKNKQKKKGNENSQLEIYYNNVNGLISKQDSLKYILEIRKPDLVALCETKLHAKSTFDIEGYEVLKSNLKAGKEGILLAAKRGTFQTTEIIFESESKQIATFEVTYPEESLRVIVVHGPQEDSSNDEKEEFYIDLQAEIQRSIESESLMVIVGDFNAKLLDEDGEIKECKGNAKKLKEVMTKYELVNLNSKPDTEGRWTRIQRKGKDVNKSVIDYVFTDHETQHRVGALVVDEDKLLTPYRTKKNGKEKSIIFSDHCAMTTSLTIVKGNKINKQMRERCKRWVLTEEGMNEYSEITKHDAGLGDMTRYSQPFDTWRKKVDSIMHLCFEKKTIKFGGNQVEKPTPQGMKLRNILREISKRGKIQREIVKNYQQRLIINEAKISTKKRAENLRKTVEMLSIDDKLSPNAFWKMKKSTNKNNVLKLPEVIKQNGVLTSDPIEIKHEVTKEFEHRLRNRTPDKDYEGYVEATNTIVQEMLKDEDDNSPPFTFKEMEDAINKMKEKTSPDYFNMHTEILTRSGKGVLSPLLQVLNIIKTNKVIPESWRRVLITMIFKNKGSRRDLEKYRGIFLTVIVSKVFERMLQARMKGSLDKVSFFQAGAKAGRSGADNLFLLRSSIDHTKFMNDSLYVTTYDFRQAFDSLWLQDCLLVLRKLGVEKYILKLLYEMNKKAVVQIKTPYGLTEPVDVTDIVKQGGVLGSPMCSATTAEYCEHNKGILLGGASIASLAFVDDIADLSTTFEDAVASHQHAISFAKRKKLELAPEKCYIMLIQPKNKSNTTPALEVGGGTVAEVDSIVYLGDVFNNKANNDDLITDRVRRGTTAMVNIQGFMRETSLGCHTLSTFLLLHQAILLSSMLFNSQAWSGVTEKNIKSLSVIQLRFLKKMMGVRRATSNAFLYLELGILPIKYEIHKRQLSFLHHIINLDEEDPVKKVWRNQTSLPKHTCWWHDVQQLLIDYSLEFDEEAWKDMSKECYKKMVKKAVAGKALKDLSEQNDEKKRTRTLKFDSISTQKYLKTMDPKFARTIFKCRSKTLNIKEHMAYKFSDQTCRWCGVCEETLQHVVNCGKETQIDNIEQLLQEMEFRKLKDIAVRVDDFLSKVEV